MIKFIFAYFGIGLVIYFFLLIFVFIINDFRWSTSKGIICWSVILFSIIGWPDLLHLIFSRQGKEMFTKQDNDEENLKILSKKSITNVGSIL